METTLTIQPGQKVTRSQKDLLLQQQVLDLIKSAGSGTKDVAIAALQNPFISLLLANCLVEYSQTVQIYDHSEERWVFVPDPLNPGMGVHQWRTVKVYRPLISQALATTIETIINSTAVVSSLGPGLIAGIQALAIKGTK